MTSESTIPDPYEAVLADLRAKRDQIDQTIAVLESLRAGGRPSPPTAPNILQPTPMGEGPGAYLGMTIPDAAIKLLSLRRQTMGNAEIAAALKAGGLVLNSADPVNTIGSVLTRRFSQVGDVVRVGRGIWGLKEWYPNRSFKPIQRVPTAAESILFEHPSEPTPDAQPE